MSEPSPIRIETGKPNNNAAKSTSGKYYGKRPKKKSPWPLIAVSSLLLVGISVVFVLAIQGQFGGNSGRDATAAGSHLLQPIVDQNIEEGKLLIVNLSEKPGGPETAYGFEGPPGAEFDPALGRISWTPVEEDGPGRFTAKVFLVEKNSKKIIEETTFAINVIEVPSFPIIEPIEDKTLVQGDLLQFRVRAGDNDFPKMPLSFRLSDDAPANASIDERTGLFRWDTGEAEPDSDYSLTVIVAKKDYPEFKSEFTFGVFLAEPREENSEVASNPRSATVGGMRDDSLAEIYKFGPGDGAEDVEIVSQVGKFTPMHQLMLDLFEKKKLFDRKSFPEIRKVHAELTAEKFAEEIKTEWGDEDSGILKWMNDPKNIGYRELFFLVLDPKNDDVPKVLRLMRQIYEKYPEKFAEFTELAIAVAVVWDNENGIEGSPTGQHRSVPASKQLGALENFEFYSTLPEKADKTVARMLKFFPVEFLCLVVNHRTPLKDRQWVYDSGYTEKRSKIGDVYGEVPYDGGMLKGEAPKLTGIEHTLPNQKLYGGVCSCQADFASRLGKTTAIPTFQAGGANKFGGAHAWVMYASIQDTYRAGFRFTFESTGRYLGDHYYVGGTVDPHLGRGTTDRELALKLSCIGRDQNAYYQTSLIMDAYATMADRLKWETKEKLDFLVSVINFYPGCTEAWRVIAIMARQGEFSTKTDMKKYYSLLDSMFGTFSEFPDFTWTVFDDLTCFEAVRPRRGEFYGRLFRFYEDRERPDLACKARLRFAQYLAEDEKFGEAVRGLAGTCLMFPEEGNFLPEIVNQMEIYAKDIPQAQKYLVGFYEEFLPQIPQKRGSEVSSYCLSMYERGIKIFEANNAKQLEEQYKKAHADLKAQGR